MESPYPAGGNVNGAAALENKQFLKQLTIGLPYDTQQFYT